LPADFVSQTQTTMTNADGSSIFQQNSQGSQYSVGQKYTFKAPATHISQLLTLPEEEIVTTVGTPHHVCVSKTGWRYQSCAECSKALITDTPPYKCKEKDHVTPEPIIKYRVEVEVRFEGHKCIFLFWDRECCELIGKSAAELQAMMIEDGEYDPHEYPASLDDMMGKELAFKVKIQAKAKMASVLNYKSDPEIIKHLKDHLNTPEDSSQVSLIPPSGGESSQMIVEHTTGTSECPAFPTQDLSATAESDPDSIKSQTPAKRPGGDTLNDDPVSGKLSSNKNMLKKAIKKEKGNAINLDA
ncbi:replication protein A1-like protein, partial [Trifolium medium]|nr:replication protein A1-like protein [Trifolium medium]